MNPLQNDKVSKKSSLQERFWNCVKKTSGCWEWTGTISHGYGLIGHKYQVVRAHRLSWEIHNGKIPFGRLVCHCCDNRKCVNPAHLFLGTYKNNNDDMVRKRRHWSFCKPEAAARGANNAASKLTAKDIPEIRRLIEAGMRYKAIGKKFNVCDDTIFRIKKGINWKHIPLVAQAKRQALNDR